MKLGSISAIMALAVLGAALWCGGAIAQTSVCTPDSFGRLICRERKQTPDPIDGMIAAMRSNCLSKSDRLTEALAAFGQPVRGGTSEALANAARVTRARQERCAAEEAVARRAAQARELARAELQMLRDQEAAANAAVAEANRRAAAQQAAQEQQRQAQLQREGQGRQDLMTVVSTAVLEGRCDDAKVAALQAGNLDLAEQAMRLCKPKPAAKVAPGRGAAGKVMPASQATPTAMRASSARPPEAAPARPTSPAVASALSQSDQGSAAYKRGDYATALSWYRKAADQGQALAQYSLGVMYTNGQGVLPDHATAFSWYQKAAAQGNANAQTSLGAMYYNGQDYAAAVSWYRKSADQGNATAQNTLKALCVQHATTTGCPYDWPGLRPR